LADFQEAEEVVTNIITPPDFVDNENHTVVLVDPSADELDHLSEFFRNARFSYNVYVYRNGMNDIDWLNQAIAKSDAFLVNTAINELSPVKDRIAESRKAWYYGPKRFLGNNNSITSPEKYFQAYENNIK